jgi:hypothetical protein
LGTKYRRAASELLLITYEYIQILNENIICQYPVALVFKYMHVQLR